MDPVAMTYKSNTPQHATLETRLTAAMRNDAEIWRERMEACDNRISRDPVRRQNPATEKAPRGSLSVFEEPVEFGRLA